MFEPVSCTVTRSTGQFALIPDGHFKIDYPDFPMAWAQRSELPPERFVPLDGQKLGENGQYLQVDTEYRH